MTASASDLPGKKASVSPPLAVSIGLPLIGAVLVFYDSSALFAVAIAAPLICMPLWFALQKRGLTSKPVNFIAGGSILIGLYAACLLVMTPFNQYDDGWLILISAAPAIVLFFPRLSLAIRRHRDNPTKFPLRPMISAAVFIISALTLYFFALSISINWTFDKSIAQVQKFTVLRKSTHISKFGINYNAEAENSNHDVLKVALSQQLYRSVRDGDTVCIRLHQGALRAKWVDTASCSR